MNRYYNKVALKIPSAREVFLSERQQEITIALDDRFKRHTVDQLRLILKGKLCRRLSSAKQLTLFRLTLFSISKALSNYGIAPRWQGLRAACIYEDQRAALAEDAPIMDVYWLALEFPKHKTINQRWQSIFINGFDIELAISIGERQLNTEKKIKAMNLSRVQQLGCIHFIKKAKTLMNGKLPALSFIKASNKRAESALRREVERSLTVKQIKPEDAQQRALIKQCWFLSEQSPTGAARIYTWMTGAKMDKGRIYRAIQKMKKT